MDRRAFLGGATCAFAFTPFAGVFAAKGERPYAKIGVMTDTHIGKDLKSCERVRMALELFRELNVGMVVNCGDIADAFSVTGYQAYRTVFNEVYSDKESSPVERYVYAWHDAFEYFGDDRSKIYTNWPEAFAEVQKHLQAPNGAYDEGFFEGIPYIVFPQFVPSERFEATIDRVVKANPNKPVLVFDHIPAAGTVSESFNWGGAGRYKFLCNYPQVIHVSGHVHGSLYAENFIWQDKFTEINAGCLQIWQGKLVGTMPEHKQSFGVLVLEFYRNRLVVRRYDVRDRSEIHPEAPWQVALPYAANKARHRPDLQRKHQPVPKFAAGAKLAVASIGGAKFAGFELTFPEASVNARAYLYRIESQRQTPSGKWETFNYCERHGDFHLLPKDRSGVSKQKLLAAYYEARTKYRFRVTPYNEFGVAGNSLVAEAMTPEYGAAAKPVYFTRNPMEELSFARRTDDAKVKADIDGEFFTTVRKDGLYDCLALPEGIFAAPVRTRFRVTIEARIRQAEDGKLWELKLVKPKSEYGACERVSTPGGDAGCITYVMEFGKGHHFRYNGDTYQVMFEYGDHSSVNLRSVKVEQL